MNTPNTSGVSVVWSSSTTAPHPHTVAHAMAPPMLIGCNQCGAQIDRNDKAAVDLHIDWHRQHAAVLALLDDDALLTLLDALGEKVRSNVRDDLAHLVEELK